MGSCKEDAFNDICPETLQLIRIHTETDSACYYIIEDYDCLTSEPLFIKLDDASYSQSSIAIVGSSITAYLREIGIGFSQAAATPAAAQAQDEKADGQKGVRP